MKPNLKSCVLLVQAIIKKVISFAARALVNRKAYLVGISCGTVDVCLSVPQLTKHLTRLCIWLMRVMDAHFKHLNTYLGYLIYTSVNLHQEHVS